MAKKRREAERARIEAKAVEHEREVAQRAAVEKKLVAIQQPAPAPAEKIFSFPTRSRCPRCGTVDTESFSRSEGSQGVQFQHRRCRGATCRVTYKVRGTLV